MKKNLIINCEICDARNMREEDYLDYERILLNAEIVLVNETSKGILNRLPIQVNTERTLELPPGTSFRILNGDYQLDGTLSLTEDVFLCVNGNLSLRPGCEKLLESGCRIYVNGDVRTPASMAPYLANIFADGEIISIPEGFTELSDVFSVDKYFPARAREHGRYFVRETVKFLDPDLDAATLAKKQVRFSTKNVLALEPLIPHLLELFDETVKFQVIPEGYSYVEGNVSLTDSLVKKYDARLYVDGNLRLKDASSDLISQIQALKVTGTVSLAPAQMDSFQKIDATFQKLVFSKDRQIENIPNVTVDADLLMQSPGGVEICNSVCVRLLEDVPPELILERLSIQNCARIKCSPAQTSALQAVSKNVASISDGTEESSQGGGHFLDLLKQIASSKVINAESYHL